MQTLISKWLEDHVNGIVLEDNNYTRPTKHLKDANVKNALQRRISLESIEISINMIIIV